MKKIIKIIAMLLVLTPLVKAHLHVFVYPKSDIKQCITDYKRLVQIRQKRHQPIDAIFIDYEFYLDQKKAKFFKRLGINFVYYCPYREIFKRW